MTKVSARKSSKKEIVCNLIDSSAWLEYFADGPGAKHFAKPIEAVSSLIVPTISIYEVFKRILVLRGEDQALQAAALMQQGRIVELSVPISLLAAQLSVELKLPMAGSIILATARTHNALLWTQDADFSKVVGVKYFPKSL